mgnify:CR=1 FL=1|tara:strand:+ start:239 stop:517 length:279 start_codon:yes stop_codon:yes gene_type:complete
MIDTISTYIFLVPWWGYVYVACGILIGEFNYARMLVLEKDFVDIMGDEATFGEHITEPKKAKKIFKRMAISYFIADFFFWPILLSLRILRSI